MALGALVMPLLIAGPGLRWGLVILSVPIVVIALLGMPRLRKLDRTVSEPEGVSLLAGVPLFAPLARPLLEGLAGKLTRIEVPAGTDVVRVGETGDRFYVIESGRLEATYDGRELSTMGAGECFGEIALLRDVPRTATVTALEDSVLQALDREDFLAAMSGRHRAARSHRVDGRPPDPDGLILCSGSPQVARCRMAVTPTEGRSLRCAPSRPSGFARSSHPRSRPQS